MKDNKADEMGIDIFPFLSPKLQQAVNAIPEELLGLDEEEYEKSVYQPTLSDRLLRQQLWKEVERASASKADGGGRFLVKNVFTGIMTADIFFDRVISNPKRMAYLIIPPKGYHLMMSNLMSMFLQKMFEIAQLPTKKPNGETDSSTVNAQIKAFGLIKESLYGAAVQRNINVTTDLDTAKNIGTKEDLDNMIVKLEEKAKRNVIEVHEKKEEIITDS